jgi:hypothetical protein
MQTIAIERTQSQKLPAWRKAFGPAEPQGKPRRPKIFLREGGQLMSRCESQGHAMSLALFDATCIVDDEQVDGETAERYMLLLVERLTALAGEIGLVGQIAPAQLALLMPMAGERIARRMIAHESRDGLQVSSARPALPWPACVVVGIDADDDEPLETALADACIEMKQVSSWMGRPARDRGPDTVITEACDGGIVATEVDALEWIRANEMPTTMYAPLHAI